MLRGGRAPGALEPVCGAESSAREARGSKKCEQGTSWRRSSTVEQQIFCATAQMGVQWSSSPWAARLSQELDEFSGRCTVAVRDGRPEPRVPPPATARLAVVLFFNDQVLSTRALAGVWAEPRIAAQPCDHWVVISFSTPCLGKFPLCRPHAPSPAPLHLTCRSSVASVLCL